MCYMILGLTFFELFKNLNVKENRILYIILFLSISNLFLSLFNTKNDLYSATFLIINIYLFFIIFDGNKKSLGKIVKVDIAKANRNTLFGRIDESKDMRAA